MNNNNFFKLTPLYKEFMILDYIIKNPNITQRTISKYLEISVSMVNSYIDNYEKKGYLIRKYYSLKNVQYMITEKGIERRKVLNIGFLNASQRVFDLAKENILTFVNQIVKKGFKNILLYGAGNVAEILLQVINYDKSVPLDVIAIIDDDHEKQGKELVRTPIISMQSINEIDYDGILISSYTKNKDIYNKLIKNQFDNNKILQFFDQ